MIQLANDPTASRPSHHAAAHEGKEAGADSKRARIGHAWPFLSRHTERPAQQDTQKQKPAANDSGS